jgi:7-cyano-7-deazaguanine synthase
MNKNAVIIFSGGLDSTTTLFYALKNDYKINAITFDYGQKHKIEIDHAKNIIATLPNIKHLIIPVSAELFSASSLIGSQKIPKNRKNISEFVIPTTYVPARNLIFLSIATAYAESNNIGNIFIGVNSQDYSGYPDCRNDFIESFQNTINLATKSGREGDPIKIHTPLSTLSKKEIILLAKKLNVPLELTWSCYDPVYLDDNNSIPCNNCDSCILRREGFKEADEIDPTFITH